MKNHTNGLQNKKYNLWLKGIIALSLSIALQSDMCGGKSGGTNGTEIQDNNSLYRAIKHQKDPKMVQDLLNDGIDCNNISRSKQDKNSLLLALEEKKKSIVEILLKQDKIDVTRTDQSTKATPLHLAISNGWEDIAIELINKLCLPDNNIDKNSDTNANGQVVPYDPEHKKKQLALYSKDLKGNTPLHLAIQGKRKKTIELLVQKLYIGALSLKNEEGLTPLHLAIQQKLKTVVNLLVTKLPIEDFVLQDAKGRNALHFAARGNDKNLFKALFDRIANLDKTKVHSILFAKDGKNGQGRTVFARAYMPEHASASKILSLNESDFRMFEYILTTTKDCLSKEELTTIYNEIEQHSSRLKPEYKLKLQGIVSQGIGNTNNASTLPQASIKI